MHNGFYTYLTERLMSRSDTQVGHSDPSLYYGIAGDQELKVTLGITG
jgi:Family of unknown function (DUF6467)